MSQEVAKPQRRKLEFRDFDEVLAEVDRLEKGGYSRAGNWDLPQACEHLSRFMAESLDGFKPGIPWLVRVLVVPLVRWWFRKKILVEGVMPTADTLPRWKPEPMAEPSAGTAAVARFRDVIGRVRSADRFHASPLLGELTVEQWRRAHLVHAAHHFGFLIPNAATSSTGAHGP
jgi:hypothetical protein